MPRQNPIKPILLAYLKAKNLEELHEALDYLSPTRPQMRYVINEIKQANRDTIALESWCLKRGYTGAETASGKKERPRKGMSKLYRTQYDKICNEWFIRLPVTPVLENLDGPARKTNVVVIWQEDRIIVTLPAHFMVSMRPNAVEHAPVPVELLPPKKKKKKRNPIVWTLATSPERAEMIEREKAEQEKEKEEARLARKAQKDLEALKEMANRSVLDALVPGYTTSGHEGDESDESDEGEAESDEAESDEAESDEA